MTSVWTTTEAFFCGVMWMATALNMWSIWRLQRAESELTGQLGKLQTAREFYEWALKDMAQQMKEKEAQ